jgi:hypothetical protein
MHEMQKLLRCLRWLQFLANTETLLCLARAKVALGPRGTSADARDAEAVKTPPPVTVSSKS